MAQFCLSLRPAYPASGAVSESESASQARENRASDSKLIQVSDNPGPGPGELCQAETATHSWSH